MFVGPFQKLECYIAPRGWCLCGLHENECTKLGLRPSNPLRHGTNVTMMPRAAHGRFEHVAASQHGCLREARGQDGQKGQIRKDHA